MRLIIACICFLCFSNHVKSQIDKDFILALKAVKETIELNGILTNVNYTVTDLYTNKPVQTESLSLAMKKNMIYFNSKSVSYYSNNNYAVTEYPKERILILEKSNPKAFGSTKKTINTTIDMLNDSIWLSFAEKVYLSKTVNTSKVFTIVFSPDNQYELWTMTIDTVSNTLQKVEMIYSEELDSYDANGNVKETILPKIEIIYTHSQIDNKELQSVFYPTHIVSFNKGKFSINKNYSNYTIYNN
jgi:hypothetical protein